MLQQVRVGGCSRVGNGAVRGMVIHEGQPSRQNPAYRPSAHFWIERPPPPKGQVTGSNPVGVANLYININILINFWLRAYDVRRQGFWDQERLNLRESLAHLVGLIMLRVGGDASAAFRVSFV